MKHGEASNDNINNNKQTSTSVKLRKTGTIKNEDKKLKIYLNNQKNKQNLENEINDKINMLDAETDKKQIKIEKFYNNHKIVELKLDDYQSNEKKETNNKNNNKSKIKLAEKKESKKRSLKNKPIELPPISNQIKETNNKEKNTEFDNAIEIFISELKKKIEEKNNKIDESIKSGKKKENDFIKNFLNIGENDFYQRGLYLVSLFNKNGNNTDNNNDNKKKRKQKLTIEKLNTVELPKIQGLIKINNLKMLQEIKCDTCITSFTILKNLNLLATFKGGHAKIYQYEDNNNKQIKYNEIISIDENEYCFNYGIELFNENIALCSQDSTIKIIKLNYKDKNYKTIQKIENSDKEPIFIIKQLNNNDLICSTWNSIILYQYLGNSKYEFITKYIIKDRTFSILEIKPNIIVSTQCYSNTIKFIDVSRFEEISEITDIESNEYPNILCKMKIKNKEIICVGNNNGFSVVDLESEKIIGNANLSDQTTSLISFRDNSVLIGSKSSNKNRTVFKFYFVNVLLKLNKKGKIKTEAISIFEPIHYYDINSLKLLNIDDRDILISSGNEDKSIKIWI